MDEPKILLVYAPLTFTSISSRVFRSFLDMTGPETQEKLAEKGVKLKFLIHDKFPMDLNRNDAFNLALSNKYQADFLMCCDMDQVFKKTTLLDLLATLEEYPDASACTGLYFTKTYPHRAVVGKYSPWSKDIELKRGSLKEQGFIAPDGQQTLFFKHLQYFDVVQPVHVFGFGCVLFRTEILKNLVQPFFAYTNQYSTGDATFYGHSEDMRMCSKLYMAGAKVICNPKIMVGHIVEKVICGNEAEN